MGLRYADVGGLVPQGISAEMIADKWDLSREDLDAFGARSQQRGRAGHRTRAASTTRSSRSRAKPLDKETGELIETDELVTRRRGHPPRHHRRDAGQPEAGLQARRQGHRRQLVADHRRRLGRAHHERGEGQGQLGLTPRARFHTFALAGVDPVTMLTGPIPATAEGAREVRA